MSYQVLARKYRPKSFATLVGQEHVVRALTHALDQQRLHHAYLFTGTRGVGKTTLSRILAKSFNCEKGVTSQPCGVCDACTAIDAGRFVDYIEMDAASNRGVDEMAALLEQAVYSPSNARFKVYMIDEVHMLTNHAFNSMLKTLEEPPPHVKFILATTDPQKIPVTVLSRCLQFNLKQMPPGHIVGHLENLLAQEHIEFEVPALRLLAKGAQGSMRDALSLTDQAIAFAAGKVSLDAVQSMLGALDQSYLFRLLDALAANDGRAMLDIADEMSARSLSFKAALQDLGSVLHQIAIAQTVPTAIADDLPERQELLRLAEQFSSEDIQLFYQIVVHGRNELGLAPDEYAGFSMTLLRLLAFSPMTSSNGTGGAVSKVISAPPQKANAPMSRAATVENAPAKTATALPETPRANHAPLSVSPMQANRSSAQTPVTEQPPPSNQESKASKLSPAMAALAAARAGSNKAKGISTPRAQIQAQTAIQSSQQAEQELKDELSPVAVSQANSSLNSVALENSANAKSAEPSIAPSLAASPEQHQVDENQMPPPWDEDLIASTTSRTSSIQNQTSEPSAIEEANDFAISTNGNNRVAKQSVVVQNEAKKHIADVSITVSARSAAPNLLPIPELDWEGDWPSLARSLAVRGVAQQLAQQSELLSYEILGESIALRLRVPVKTLLSAGSLEKLESELTTRFGRTIRIETELAAVTHTANTQMLEERAAQQLVAEAAINNDFFVQSLMREFGAHIATGSVRPI